MGQKTKTVFYQETEIHVLAVFLEETVPQNGLLHCYSKVGEHVTCSLGYLKDLKLASKKEAKKMKEYLEENFFYKIKILKKMPKNYKLCQ